MSSHSDDSDDDLVPSIEKMTELISQSLKEGWKSTASKKKKRDKFVKEKCTSSQETVELVPSPKKTTLKRPRFFNFDPTPKKIKLSASGCSSGLLGFSNDTVELLRQSETLTTRRIPGTRKNETVPAKSTKQTSNKKKKKLVKPAVQDSEDMDIDLVDISDSLPSPLRVNSPANEMRTVKLLYKMEPIRIDMPVNSNIAALRLQVAKKLELRADETVLYNPRTNDTMADKDIIDNIPLGITLEVMHWGLGVDKYNCNAYKLGDNFIQLKIQGEGHHRQRISVPIQRTTHVQQLIDDYIEKFELQGKKFKLIFDGYVLDPTETPESLDLEGDEMIEIVEIR